MRRFLKSFVYAGRGTWFCLRRERNFRFHLVAAVYVLSFAPLFSLSRGEWAALIAVVGLIPALEAVNTAVEQVVNLASPDRHPLARAAKDAAAAAVLLACLAALGIAVALFWRPETWSDILADWRQDLWKPVLLVLSLPLAGWFVLGGGDSPAQRKAE